MHIRGNGNELKHEPHVLHFISKVLLLHTTYILVYIYIYRVPRRIVPDFGRVFLMAKYTDITQNIYVQS
jgi:hypothetical protein